MLGTWLVIFVEAGTIMGDRMKEICLVVAEENCLPSGDTIAYDTLGGGHGGVNYQLNLRKIYTELLNTTAQQSNSFAKHFIFFADDAIKVHDAKKSCEGVGLADQYYSIASAPQRGKQLCVEVEAELQLPVFIYVVGSTNKMPTGFQGKKSYERVVPVKISRSLKIYGTHYYKDKDFSSDEYNPFA